MAKGKTKQKKKYPQTNKKSQKHQPKKTLTYYASTL